MLEIEKYPCTDGNEARARERYWFEELNASLNTKVPNRTKVEYKLSYIENNKEKYKESNKKYNDAHSKEHKEYYEKNKIKIYEKSQTKYECECGSLVCIGYKLKHMTTTKHNHNIIQQNNKIIII